MRRAVAIAFCLAVAQPARADDATFRYDLRLDLPLIAVGGAGWIVSEVLKGSLAPSSCVWCASNDFDRAARDALRISDEAGADLASSVIGFGLVPLLTLGLDVVAAGADHRLRGAGVDLLLIVEAGVMAGDLDQITKFASGRERPFVHALPETQKSSTATPSDNNLSFFSGHSSLTFSLAVASGTVATMRRYRLAPLVWAVGLALASTTAYLRVAADKHYLSDVLVGSLVGGACGFVVPWVFHGVRRSAAPRAAAVSATSQGAAVTLAWRW